MNIRLRQIIYSLGIVGVILLSQNVYSQPHEDDFNRHEEMREKMKAKMLAIFEQLNLSPEQTKQLATHRNNHREQGGEFRELLREKKEAIGNELQNEELNMEEVYRIHDELKGLLLKKADFKLDGILEVREILTVEQFRKFRELRKSMHPMKKRRKKFY